MSKIRLNFYRIITPLLIVFLFSCEDNFDIEYKTDTKLYSIGAEILKVEAISSEDYIKIENCPTWSAETNQEWITLVDNHGANNDFLYYKVENNTEKNNREGLIMIFSEGKHVKTFKIIQDYSYIKSSQDKFDISYKSNDLIISIHSNGYWTISAEDSWITTDVKEGMCSQDVKISISNNESGQKRIGLLKFVDQANNEAIITITQQGLGIYVDISDIVVGCIENEIKIDCTADAGIIFESDSWIQCKYNDGAILISIENNLSSSERVGTIEMSLDGINDFPSLKINIIQKEIMFGYIDLGIISQNKIVTFDSSLSHLSLCNNKDNDYMHFPADGFTRDYEGKFPSKEEFDLLIKLTHKIVTVNGTRGYIFMGSNKNSLFIPCGRYWDSTVENYGGYGYFYSFSESDIIRDHDGGMLENARGLFVKRTDAE